MEYESNILKRLIDTYGVVGNPRYISEIIKEFIVQGKERFPNLFTYQSDWLAHIDEFGLNPSYTVSYTGQSIYAPNTLEKPVKSAILKGQTLVNLAIEKGIVFNEANQWKHLGINQSLLNSSKKYLISFDSSHDFKGYVHLRDSATNHYITDAKHASFKQGNNKVLIDNFEQTDLNAFSSIKITFWLDSASVVFPTISNVILLEYVDGMENWDIPYFEGMQSVKTPVLTTTGKNLFDKEAFYNDWKSKEETYVYKETVDGEEVLKIYNSDLLFRDEKGFKIYVKKGVPLTMSFKCKKAGTIDTKAVFSVRISDTSFVDIGRCNSYEWTQSSESFTPTRDYITVCSAYEKEDYYYVKDIQLEYDTQLTSYEPYKSNILTTPEDLELRGIGEVKDELNVATGELTQRIGEVVLDGSEAWTYGGGNSNETIALFYLKLDDNKNSKPSINNRLPSIGGYSVNFGEGVYVDSDINIRIKRNKLNGSTVNNFKQWLSNNPITLQYKLNQSSIKTVDLTILDQNGQNAKQLMSFNGGTHFNTGSLEGTPLPSVSVSVETDLEETLKVCSLEGNTM